MTGDDVRGLAREARLLEPTLVAGLSRLCESVESIAAELEQERGQMARETSSLLRRVDELESALVVSERNRERFRYALFVYLQEHDGPAGKNAPTPETLKLIRELIQELR